MARAIFIFLVAAVIAVFVVWVVSNPGWVTADWFGYRFEAPMSIATLMLIGLFAVLLLLIHVVRSIIGGPAAWQRHFRERRKRRGMGALTQGLAAAAAGDAHLAHRQAARAGRLVKDGPLAQVLALEAAMLEERRDDVAALAPALLDHPETELLGRRALFDLARKKGDRTAEVDQAEAAFANHPAAGWAAETLLADAVRAQDWDRARSVLGRAVRHDAFANGRAAKIKAALLLAEAQAHASSGETGKAAALARKAWESDSDLVAAAVLRADQLVAAGKPRAARELAAKVWGRLPHPELGRIFAAPDPGEPQDEHFARLRSLVGANPDHIESRLLIAEQAIAARHIVAARDALKPILEAGGSARAFALMATLERVEHGAAAHPEDWMEKALAAPRDAVWVCGACGHRETVWHAVCARCGAVARALWATHDKVAAEPAAVPEKKPAPEPAPTGAAPPPEAVPAPAAVRPTASSARKKGRAKEPSKPSAPAAPVRQPDDPGADETGGPGKEREW